MWLPRHLISPDTCPHLQQLPCIQLPPMQQSKTKQTYQVEQASEEKYENKLQSDRIAAGLISKVF